MDLTSFPKFLQEQYVKIQKFYKNFQEQYPELFGKYYFPEKMNYTSNELKEAFNAILNSTYNELTINEIEYLLEIDNSYVWPILKNSIELYKTDVTKAIISRMAKIETNYIKLAIEAHNMHVFRMLIDRKTEIGEKFDNEVLIYAMCSGIYSYVSILYDKMENIEPYCVVRILIMAIKANDLCMVQKVLKNVTYISDEMFDIATEIANPLIVKALANHCPDTNYILINLKNGEIILQVMPIIENRHIATFIVSDDSGMIVKSLINKVGEDRVLNIAIKLSNATVVKEILNEKEKIGKLNKEQLDEIFNIAIKKGNDEVIENVMSKMPEVTDKHLKMAIESENLPKIKKVIDKMAIETRDSLLQSYFANALQSTDTFHNSGIASTLLDIMEKIQDEDKYNFLDLTISRFRDLFIFEKLLDKVGEIDDAHLKGYLSVINPFTPVSKKLVNMMKNITNEDIDWVNNTGNKELVSLVLEKCNTQNAIPPELFELTHEAFDLINIENNDVAV